MVRALYGCTKRFKRPCTYRIDLALVRRPECSVEYDEPIRGKRKEDAEKRDH